MDEKIITRIRQFYVEYNFDLDLLNQLPTRVDMLITQKKVVFIFVDSRPVPIVAGGLVSGTIAGLIELYQRKTNDREINMDLLDGLIENGHALYIPISEINISINDVTKPLYDVLMMLDSYSVLNLSGIFHFYGKQSNGNIKFIYQGTAKQAKKRFESYIPTSIKIMPEKIERSVFFK